MKILNCTKFSSKLVLVELLKHEVTAETKSKKKRDLMCLCFRSKILLLKYQIRKLFIDKVARMYLIQSIYYWLKKSCYMLTTYITNYNKQGKA